MDTTKTQQAINFFKNNEFKKAFKIFAGFRLNFNKDEIRYISIAHECIGNPNRTSYYTSIDVDVDYVIEKSKEIIKNKYKL